MSDHERAAGEEHPWPPERWPTAEEWLPWFESLPPDYRLTVAVDVIENAQQAERCRMLHQPTATDPGEVGGP